MEIQNKIEENSTPKDLFENIMSRMLDQIGIHDDFSHVCDFLGLEGYHNWHNCEKYHKIKFFTEMRSNCLKHLNIIVMADGKEVDVIPKQLININKMDIDSKTRMQFVRYMLETWLQFEIETREILISYIKFLNEKGLYDYNHDFKQLLNKVVCDISDIQDEIIECQSTDYTSHHCMIRQYWISKKYSNY